MPGLLRAVGRTAVVAGTATAVSNRVSRRQASRWQDQAAADQYYAEQSQAQAAPPPPAQDDTLERLKELGELKNSGVLTDAEFEAQKAKILAGL
jgi:membrane protease subunit (stomatin/prohibitin family)